MSASGRDLAEILREMRRDPAADFSTSAAAQRLGTSPQRLIQQFRRLTGVSPLRFRAAIRIDAAKHLLATSDLPVTEVAARCGYDSLGTFVRTFHAMVGISPTGFRHSASDGGSTLAGFTLGGDEFDEIRVAGIVPNPRPDRAMLVALGLFHNAIPVSRPLAGAVFLGCGRFLLPAPASGPLHLLGFAIPEDHSLWLASASDEIHVFSQELTIAGPEILLCEPKWRRLTLYDPPIVFALPVLHRDFA